MFLESFLRGQEVSLDQLATICHGNLITLYQSEASQSQNQASHKQIKAKSRKVTLFLPPLSAIEAIKMLPSVCLSKL